MKPIVIGMAEMAIVKEPESIITYGLGSCVGLVLYDRINKIAGMVHIVLAENNKMAREINVAKFADTAVDALLLNMVKKGANRSSIIAKMAGGAHMFANMTNNNPILNVGEKNVKVTKERLLKLNIPLISEDVFGSSGRTVEFFPSTGDFKIKMVGKGEKMI